MLSVFLFLSLRTNQCRVHNEKYPLQREKLRCRFFLSCDFQGPINVAVYHEKHPLPKFRGKSLLTRAYTTLADFTSKPEFELTSRLQLCISTSGNLQRKKKMAFNLVESIIAASSNPDTVYYRHHATIVPPRIVNYPLHKTKKSALDEIYEEKVDEEYFDIPDKYWKGGMKPQPPKGPVFRLRTPEEEMNRGATDKEWVKEVEQQKKKQIESYINYKLPVNAYKRTHRVIRKVKKVHCARPSFFLSKKCAREKCGKQ